MTSLANLNSSAYFKDQLLDESPSQNDAEEYWKIGRHASPKGGPKGSLKRKIRPFLDRRTKEKAKMSKDKWESKIIRKLEKWNLVLTSQSSRLKTSMSNIREEIFNEDDSEQEQEILSKKKREKFVKNFRNHFSAKIAKNRSPRVSSVEGNNRYMLIKNWKKSSKNPTLSSTKSSRPNDLRSSLKGSRLCIDAALSKFTTTKHSKPKRILYPFKYKKSDKVSDKARSSRTEIAKVLSYQRFNEKVHFPIKRRDPNRYRQIGLLRPKSCRLKGIKRFNFHQKNFVKNSKKLKIQVEKLNRPRIEERMRRRRERFHSARKEKIKNDKNKNLRFLRKNNFLKYSELEGNARKIFYKFAVDGEI